MRYRKKPVVIEAIQYTGGGNMDIKQGIPDWIWDAFESGALRSTDGRDPLMIVTLEGNLTVSPMDFIIQGVQGELYPVKPDIFEATYDLVEE